mgnify:CR=1 FL=1
MICFSFTHFIILREIFKSFFDFLILDNYKIPGLHEPNRPRMVSKAEPQGRRCSAGTTSPPEKVEVWP